MNRFRGTPKFKPPVKLYFKWFDFWVGLFWDAKARALYIGILPMLGVRIILYRKQQKFCLDCLATTYCRENRTVCRRCGQEALMKNSVVGGNGKPMNILRRDEPTRRGLKLGQ